MDTRSVVHGIRERFGAASVREQETRDNVPTLWVRRDDVCAVLAYLKQEIARSMT